MIIKDNALPKDQFVELQQVILDTNFPWYYARTTYDGEVIDNPYKYGWVHVAFKDGQWNTPHSKIIEDAIITALQSANEPACGLFRVRLILNTTSPTPELNGAHVDLPGPHKTALLYLNDADGDTVLYNEQWCGDDQLPEKYTVMQTVAPIANRLLCFNGLHFHTGTLPTKINRRVVLNINYE